MQNLFFQYIIHINEKQTIFMLAHYFLIISLLILLYFFYKKLKIKNINNFFFMNQVIPIAIIIICIIIPNIIFFISIFLWFLFFLTLLRSYNFYLVLPAVFFILSFWHVLLYLKLFYNYYKIIINKIFRYIFRHLRVILNFDFLFSSTRCKFVWIFYKSKTSRSYRERYYANERAHARFFKRYYKSMNFNDSNESLLYFEKIIHLLKYFFYFFFKKIFNFISFFSSWPFRLISIIFYIYFEVKARKYSNPYYIHEIVLSISSLIIIFFFKVSLFHSFCIFIYFCFLLFLYLNDYSKILFSVLRAFVIFSFACSFLLYIFETFSKVKNFYNKFKNSYLLFKKKHGPFTNYCSYHEYIQKRVLLKGFSKYFKRTDFNDSFVNRKNINADSDWFLETLKSLSLRFYFNKQRKEDKVREKEYWAREKARKKARAEKEKRWDALKNIPCTNIPYRSDLKSGRK